MGTRSAVKDDDVSTYKYKPKQRWALTGRKWSKKHMASLKTAVMAAPTLEELLPETIPTVETDPLEKTARVKLTRDYWPIGKVINEDFKKPGRLLAGSSIRLPISEAKQVVANGGGTLAFDE